MTVRVTETIIPGISHIPEQFFSAAEEIIYRDPVGGINKSE
jgi:hypothetical protein